MPTLAENTIKTLRDLQNKVINGDDRELAIKEYEALKEAIEVLEEKQDG